MFMLTVSDIFLQSSKKINGPLRMAAVGWPLVAGCWSLAAGRWLLVAGYWLLVTGRNPVYKGTRQSRQ